MRLGRINTFGNHDLETYERIKNDRLEFAEICCNFDKDIQSVIEQKEKIKKNSELSGVDVSCVGRWNHEVLKDGKIDGEKLSLYKELLDTSVYLGARTFVCGCNYDESISLYKNYTKAIEFFGALCDHAKGKNIKVAIQNCHWNNFVVSPEEWKVILGEIPGLCIKFDASHAYNRNANYLDELADWGERVAHVHIKGTTHAGKEGKVDDPPAGMDDLKWGSIFAVLYSVGYDGDLSIEPHSKTWHGPLGDAGILFTRDFIRKFMVG